MKKKIRLDSNYNAITEPKTKRKPAVPYVEAEWLKEYRTERDICLYIQGKIERMDWTDEQVQKVKEKYFKNYQSKLL